MRAGTLITAAVVVSLVAAEVAQGQGCVRDQNMLRGGAVTGSARSIKLAITNVSAGGRTSRHIPFKWQSSLKCVLVISPELGVSDLQVTILPTINPDTLLTLRVESAHHDVVGEAVPLRDSQPQTLTVRLTLATLAEQDVPLTFVASYGTNASEPANETALSLVIHYSPALLPSYHTARTDCGARLCFFDGYEESVYVDGIDGTESQVGELEVSNDSSTYRKVQLLSGPNGRYFKWKDYTATKHLEVKLPLGTRRVLISDTSEISAYDTTLNVVVERAADPFAVFRFADGQKGDLSILRGGSPGVDVRMRVQVSQDPAGGNAQLIGVLNKFQNDRTYQIREGSSGSSGATVAEFTVTQRATAGDPELHGIIVPVTPTRQRAPSDSPPRLTIVGEGLTESPIVTSFVVLPKAQIERYVLVGRDHRPDATNAAVTPLEHVRLRLEGPSVGYLTQGAFGAAGISLAPQVFARDSLLVEFTVPRQAGATEDLVMQDKDGVVSRTTVRVVPAQRLRRLAAFAQLSYLKERAVKMLGFERDSEVESSRLTNVLLRFKRDRIDTADAAFGVQYIDLEADLYDAGGKKVGSASKCLAVVPPSLPNALYHVEGDCTPVFDNAYSISDLIEPTQRATVASALHVRVRHQADKYPYDDAEGYHELTIVRGGHVIFEPRYQLPGPVFAFRSGSLSPAITYAGAVLTFVPSYHVWEDLIGRALTFETGLVVGSVPDKSVASDNAVAGRLSGTLGVDWIVKNMLGDVTLDFFAGRVFPISGRGLRARDAFFAFRPGFSIPLGGSSSVAH